MLQILWENIFKYDCKHTRYLWNDTENLGKCNCVLGKDMRGLEQERKEKLL